MEEGRKGESNDNKYSIYQHKCRTSSGNAPQWGTITYCQTREKGIEVPKMRQTLGDQKLHEHPVTCFITSFTTISAIQLPITFSFFSF